MRYRKIAYQVTADKSSMDCYIDTLEGISTAHKGDYIVTGVDNEQWVVKPEYFSTSYSHIRGNQYRRIPQVVNAVLTNKDEVSHAPTGDIHGTRGDYRVTGSKGEVWYVKPDIFAKTYERVSKSMDMTNLQKSIEQIGMEAVQRYLPKGAKLHPCDMHGHFLAHYKDSSPTCPLCITTGTGEGTTATTIEHWINIKDNVQATTGYRPQG